MVCNDKTYQSVLSSFFNHAARFYKTTIRKLAYQASFL